MDRKELTETIRHMKKDLDRLLSGGELEPFAKCNLESIEAHVTLLYNELGLDFE